MSYRINKAAHGLRFASESLEPRIFFAITHWIGGTGLWNVAANWSGGAVPTAADDAVVDQSGNYVVTMGAAGTTIVKSLTIDADSTSLIYVELGIGGNKVLRTESIALISSLGGNCSFEMWDNDMIVDYSTIFSPLSYINASIAGARNGGFWDGFGITSNAASGNVNGCTTLGAMEATDYWNVNFPGAQFDSETLDSTCVLVKYTCYGDADFNGEVNFDDYVLIDTGFNLGLTGWVNGDFNQSEFGEVDFDDYVLIDTAFNCGEC